MPRVPQFNSIILFIYKYIQLFILQYLYSVLSISSVVSMGAAGYIFLLNATFSKTKMSLIRPLTPCLYNPIIKKYNQASKGYEDRHESGTQERAPSTAEVIDKMAEEKLREADHQAFDDKIFDGAEKATLGEPKLDSAKNTYKDKEHQPGADYRRRGDDHDDH
ncbi:uncharacterized protein LOC133782348 [Humulus lupulus]|uniref:uncharacterized protein LOC133782348 n=1 Tax=Humulus lupulus TaxID=3486 RepID=UPI002B4075EF|nr:uncharacterized protein LOC133782348 [Humulus lupulus]